MINPQKPYEKPEAMFLWKRLRTEPIIKLQMYPKTIPPTRFGMKKTLRKKLDPFRPLLRRTANAKAKTLTMTDETMAKRTVIPREYQNVVPGPKAWT